MKTIFNIFLSIGLLSNLTAQTSETFFKNGMVYYQAENYQKAITEFTEAIILNPADTDAFYYRAWAKQKLKDAQGAIADYTKAIALNPKFAEAFYFRGVVKAQLKDNLGAIADYTSAIEINADYGAAYYNRGIAKFNAGLKDSGCIDMNMAVKLKVKEAKTTKKIFCN